ncbi:general secretion pathway protein G [Sulfurifustis variabilis]|uniref:Type II secretion system core protein G n=1 Tax=Sulfurifustis variabilis TaxID=1675686 RepID=A0A1C7AFG8_9GAMM|nr:type II secretion system major pseudopilin GspG [Sulfurifustis variabilis]BAU50065.1 general secretion pathway protein G [Sulfurifustis variabilis]
MRTRRSSKNAHEGAGPRGFTLLELLVVLVILSLLAGLVGPQVMKHVGASKTKTAHVQIEELATALDVYRLETGAYPTTAQGLALLVEKPAGLEGWNGPYLRKPVLPKDPWGREYRYRAPGEHGPYDLYTFGADNVEGGEGENADVASWK